jgi:predicted enzyme related to lactoylglutathione lyase
MNAISLIVYSVGDVAEATSFFGNVLGSDPYVESPYYTGFKTADVEIGLVPKGASPEQPSPLVYVDVPDINVALHGMLARGAKTVQDVTDVAQGLLVASVRTGDGNTIGLRQLPKG